MIPLDLSATELDVVWRAAGFGALPLVIDVPSPGASHAERAVIERDVWRGLVERGLAEDHGRPAERLAARLDTIARRGQSLELRVFGADETRAILATRGKRSVLGVLGDRFTLTSVPAPGRAATLLALLPDVPAGPGYSVSVDTDAFVAAAGAGSPATAQDRLRRRGLGTDDARTLLDMATGAIRTIQIVAETPAGRSEPLAAHDTPRGRYRVLRTTTDFSDHLTITPATPATLADAVTQLLNRHRTRPSTNAPNSSPH